MNYLNKYSIPFHGLNEERCKYNFFVDNKFFEQFENSEIENGQADVRVILEKNINSLVLEFDITGKVLVECNRCLELFYLPIKYKGNIFAKIGNENFEDTNGNVHIAHTLNELNIAQYIYEFINLSLPIKRVHPDDDNGNSLCNKEMLKKIEELSYKKLNNNINNNWNKLKDLIK
ncbi:MAG: DUF177 domain-containing protein [Bacteroidales bacterium]|nr:DUF177 domain-containing protein [Bacteroidales bacterium]